MADRFDLDAIEADDALLDLLAAGGEPAWEAGEHDPALKLLAGLRLAVEVEDELPVETIDDPESFLARCAALTPVMDPFARKMAARSLALGVAAVAALSVSGVAAAVTGDPLSPYEKVIEKVVDGLRSETSVPKEQLDGMPVFDKTKIVKVAKDFEQKAKDKEKAKYEEQGLADVPAQAVVAPKPPLARPIPQTEQQLQVETPISNLPAVETQPEPEQPAEPVAPEQPEPTDPPTTPADPEPTDDPTTPVDPKPTDPPTSTPTDPPTTTPTDPTTTPTDPTTTPTTPGGTNGSTGDNGNGQTGNGQTGNGQTGNGQTGNGQTGNGQTGNNGSTGDNGSTDNPTTPSVPVTPPTTVPSTGGDTGTGDTGTGDTGTGDNGTGDTNTGGDQTAPGGDTSGDQGGDQDGNPDQPATPDNPVEPVTEIVATLLPSLPAASSSKVEAPPRRLPQYVGNSVRSVGKHSNGKPELGWAKARYAKGKHSSGRYAEGQHAAIARAHGSMAPVTIRQILGVLNTPMSDR